MSRELPLIGSSIRMVDCGKTLHRVPDHIVMVDLANILQRLYRKGWYACLMFSNGRGTLRGDERKAPRPPREVAERLLDLAVKVNRELHHDGHWVSVWSHGRISLLWRDQDGDGQFTVDYDEPWIRVSTWSVDDMASRAEAGFAAWTERMRAVDRRPEETILAAQGEPSRSPFPTIH